MFSSPEAPKSAKRPAEKGGLLYRLLSTVKKRKIETPPPPLHVGPGTNSTELSSPASFPRLDLPPSNDPPQETTSWKVSSESAYNGSATTTALVRQQQQSQPKAAPSITQKMEASSVPPTSPWTAQRPPLRTATMAGNGNDHKILFSPGSSSASSAFHASSRRRRNRRPYKPNSRLLVTASKTTSSFHAKDFNANLAKRILKESSGSFPLAITGGHTQNFSQFKARQGQRQLGEHQSQSRLLPLVDHHPTNPQQQQQRDLEYSYNDVIDDREQQQQQGMRNQTQHAKKVVNFEPTYDAVTPYRDGRTREYRGTPMPPKQQQQQVSFGETSASINSRSTSTPTPRTHYHQKGTPMPAKQPKIDYTTTPESQQAMTPDTGGSHQKASRQPVHRPASKKATLPVKKDYDIHSGVWELSDPVSVDIETNGDLVEANPTLPSLICTNYFVDVPDDHNPENYFVPKAKSTSDNDDVPVPAPVNASSSPEIIENETKRSRGTNYQPVAEEIGWGSFGANMFANTKNKWKCPSCSVYNEKTNPKCCSCDVQRPSTLGGGDNDGGTSAVATTSSSAPVSVGAPAAPSAFTFGAPPPKETSSTIDSSSITPTGGFTFGAQPAKEKGSEAQGPDDTKFQFGSKPDMNPKPFAFPVESNSEKKSDGDSPDPVSTGRFSFGGASSAKINEATGTTAPGALHFGDASGNGDLTVSDPTKRLSFGGVVEAKKPPSKEIPTEKAAFSFGSAKSSEKEASLPVSTATAAFSFGSSNDKPIGGALAFPSEVPLEDAVTCAPSSSLPPTSSVGSSSMFSFGSVPATSDAPAPAPSGLSFGAPPSADPAVAEEDGSRKKKRRGGADDEDNTGTPAFSFGGATPAPPAMGAATVAAQPAFSFGAAAAAPVAAVPTAVAVAVAAQPSFSFGAAAAAPVAAVPVAAPTQPGFSFGTAPAAAAPAAAAPPVSNFGGTANTIPSAAPFTNAATPAPSIPAPSMSFGSAPAPPAAAPAFAFGAAAPVPPPTTGGFGSTPAAPVMGGFAPAQAAPPAAGFSFGASAAPVPPANAGGGFSNFGGPTATPVAAAPGGFGGSAGFGAAAPSAGFAGNAAPMSAPMSGMPGGGGGFSIGTGSTPATRGKRRIVRAKRPAGARTPGAHA